MLQPDLILRVLAQAPPVIYTGNDISIVLECAVRECALAVFRARQRMSIPQFTVKIIVQSLRSLAVSRVLRDLYALDQRAQQQPVPGRQLFIILGHVPFHPGLNQFVSRRFKQFVYRGNIQFQLLGKLRHRHDLAQVMALFQIGWSIQLPHASHHIPFRFVEQGLYLLAVPQVVTTFHPVIIDGGQTCGKRAAVGLHLAQDKIQRILRELSIGTVVKRLARHKIQVSQ